MSKFTAQLLWFFISAAAGLAIAHYFMERTTTSYVTMALGFGIASLLTGMILNKKVRRQK